MRKVYFLLLFIAFGHAVQAQVPGYKGKRVLLGYSEQMAPNLGQWLDNVIHVPFRLHPKHIISAEYIAGRHTSIALDAGFARYSRTQTNGYELPIGEIEMHGSFIGANVKIFGKNLAPIGSYFSVYMHEMFMNFNDTAGVSNYGDYVVTKKPITGKFNTTAFGVVFGTRRVIRNTVVLDAGIGVGFSTNTYKSGNLLINPAATDIADNFMLYRNLLSYKIGLSGLLF